METNTPIAQPQTFFQKNRLVIGLGSVVGILLVLIIVMLVVYANQQRSSDSTDQTSYTNTTNPTANPPTQTPASTSNSSDNDVRWSFDQNWIWAPMGNPPDCENPLILQPPVDLSEVTSILYPGQIRGDSYKPHGGFRFDNKIDNKVDVVAPYDSVLVGGTRLLVNGELQYGFDFENPCGFRYRLGHLLQLTPELQAIADQFPAAQEGDSRFTSVNPPVEISAGELLATEIGVTVGGVNTFLDWGVYDLRQQNSAAADPAWLAAHPGEHAAYGVCWFDWLSPQDEATVRGLSPSDGTSATQSDYCE
jgi:hypothetical protein